MNLDMQRILTKGRQLAVRRNNIYLYKGQIFKLCRLEQDYAYTYRNEARVLGELNRRSYPHAPQMYWHGEVGGYFVICLERLRGRELGRDDSRFRRAVEAAILSLRHHGFVHRDLVPSNIFLCRSWIIPWKHRVVFLDFQFARLFSEEIKLETEPDRKDFVNRLPRVGGQWKPLAEVPLESYDTALFTNLCQDYFGG